MVRALWRAAVVILGSEIAGTASEKRPSDESAVKDFAAVTQLYSGTQFKPRDVPSDDGASPPRDQDDPPGFWCLDLA